MIFTELALLEIDAIIDFLAKEKRKPLRAAKLVESLDDAFEKFRHNPTKYMYCSSSYGNDVYARFRFTKCHQWLIFFKVEAEVVTILGLLHESYYSSSFKYGDESYSYSSGRNILSLY